MDKEIESNIIIDYLYKEIPVLKICEKYKIGTAQLYRCLANHGINPCKNKSIKFKYFDIIEDYKSSNLSIKELCNKYNISYNTLYYNLKYYNLKPLKHNKAREIHKKIIKDYLNGISTTELAKKYNKSSGNIRYILNENNIELRSKKENVSENQKKVMNLLINEGLSQAEVARRLNVSKQRISKLYLKCKEKNYQW